MSNQEKVIFESIGNFMAFTFDLVPLPSQGGMADLEEGDLFFYFLLRVQGKEWNLFATLWSLCRLTKKLISVQ